MKALLVKWWKWLVGLFNRKQVIIPATPVEEVIPPKIEEATQPQQLPEDQASITIAQQRLLRIRAQIRQKNRRR